MCTTDFTFHIVFVFCAFRNVLLSCYYFKYKPFALALPPWRLYDVQIHVAYLQTLRLIVIIICTYLWNIIITYRKNTIFLCTAVPPHHGTNNNFCYNLFAVICSLPKGIINYSYSGCTLSSHQRNVILLYK